MKLRFSSYKRFASKEEIEIRPITILLGKNNSGKSSVIKLLVSFISSLSGTTPYPGLNLGGKAEGFSLGPSLESITHNGYKTGLEVGMTLDCGISLDVSMFNTRQGMLAFKSYDINTGADIIRLHINTESGQLESEDGIIPMSTFNGLYNRQIFDKAGLTELTRQRVDYIGPLRMAPERIWYVNNIPSATDGVDSDGRTAYNLLCKDPALLEKVNCWFKDNLDGCQLYVEQGNEPGSYIIKVRQGSDDCYGVNIADVGMGINQVLPLVVSAMNDNGPAIIAIEQAELHLHPAAHASVAQLMAEATGRTGRKFIVETHSANLLLGIRNAVADPTIPLDRNDVIIYFIDEDDEGAYIRQITIEPGGILSSWPTGVFGESYELLKSIQRNTALANDKPNPDDKE